ncbi:hypothetical protein L211DRAFT_825130 [Terfezia boudieri ATCC MYA-4762]|uniref:BTB domain-containing protein n=1 Tax=Terfezia boudieri ATCC MYA-4762 TaxID=1051890 RepID=A0A3N4LRR9_9PEZI|nr:hypothetical protein L211DRAFT_825130 [Terfezia boudieri ATCC MYA-4762]
MRPRIFFLSSDVFKIVLKDAISESQDSPSPIATKSGSGNPEYYIHKTLLSSLSTELHKHVNNDMKEGKENLIELGEVDEPTVEAFLEWAYFKDYQPAILAPKSAAALPYHTKIYVLADRFNIPLLKNLAFSKITALLAELGMVAERTDLVAMVTAVTYAYDNLLVHSRKPSVSGSTLERLLQYFTQYISWALDAFRSNDEFKKLLASNSDFAEALVVSCSPALTPPWIMDVITGASVATSNKSEEIILTPSTDSNHILYRKCSCGYTGVMGVQCASCARFDDQVGTDVKYYGKLLGTFGAGRISGSQKNFRYTCRWCQVVNAYNTSNKSFYCQNYGNPSAQLCLGYMRCPKCQSRGYNTGSGYNISFA